MGRRWSVLDNAFWQLSTNVPPRTWWNVQSAERYIEMQLHHNSHETETFLDLAFFADVRWLCCTAELDISAYYENFKLEKLGEQGLNYMVLFSGSFFTKKRGALYSDGKGSITPPSSGSTVDTVSLQNSGSNVYRLWIPHLISQLIGQEADLRRVPIGEKKYLELCREDNQQQHRFWAAQKSYVRIIYDESEKVSHQSGHRKRCLYRA